MASLTSVSLHSTSPLGFAFKHDESSCSMVTVRFTRQGLSSQFRCAATKEAKSPGSKEFIVPTTKYLLINLSSFLLYSFLLYLLLFFWGGEVAEVEWKINRELLLQKKVRSVDAKEALRLQKENKFVILDVRLVKEFNDAHPPNAINAQIYRLIKEWTAWDITRRAAFAFFGIFAGTEENPEFLQTVESNLDEKAKIIVACAAGGTMKPTQNLPEGQQSRSLIAAYLLVLNGYTNVSHLEGGLYSWFKEGLPIESDEE